MTGSSHGVNMLKDLKDHHQDQLDKLTVKNQHEIDMLEDIRSFIKQKCSLEKTYAEGLLKLSSNFQNKKRLNVPDIKSSVVEWNVNGRCTDVERRRVSVSAGDATTGKETFWLFIHLAVINKFLDPNNMK